MQVTSFKIDEERLFICDMRPGFSEDGLDITLPRGNYYLALIDHEEIQCFEFVMEGLKPDREEVLGKFSVDGSCIGVFDKNMLSSRFKDNWESLYEWSAENLSGGKWKDLTDKEHGLAFYVSTFFDCEFLIFKLFSSEGLIGFRVTPIKPVSQETQDRSWLWVSFKCKGIDTQEFNICHDRDYDLDIDEVRENLLSELCTVETEDTLEFIDEEEVKLDEPIASYRDDFRGIMEIEVKIETKRLEEHESRVLDFQTDKILSKIDVNVSTNELAKLIYEIFRLQEKG